MASASFCAADGANRAEVEAVLHDLEALRADLFIVPPNTLKRLDAVHPHFRESALNLLHYLGLRRHDLRVLQGRLAALGLSSLGRAESNVLATVNTVLHVLHRLVGRVRWSGFPGQLPSLTSEAGSHP